MTNTTQTGSEESHKEGTLNNEYRSDQFATQYADAHPLQYLTLENVTDLSILNDSGHDSPKPFNPLHPNPQGY
jgi:hypothetical protein